MPANFTVGRAAETASPAVAAPSTHLIGYLPLVLGIYVHVHSCRPVRLARPEVHVGYTVIGVTAPDAVHAIVNQSR